MPSLCKRASPRDKSRAIGGREKDGHTIPSSNMVEASRRYAPRQCADTYDPAGVADFLRDLDNEAINLLVATIDCMNLLHAFG